MSKVIIVAFALALGSATALADVDGTLGLGSSGFIQATLTSWNWTPDSSALPVPGPPWNADVNSATTLTFAGGPLSLREGALINGGQPFGSPPPDAAGIYNPFIQFEVHPNLLYFLTAVDPGSANTNCAALANGQSCSIEVAGTPSPILLTRLGSSTIFSIGMLGFATDGVGPTSNWIGGFSATIPNMTPLDIVQFYCGTDDVCSASDVAAGKVLDVRSVSGSFESIVSAVPEPGAFALTLTALGSVIFAARRRAARNLP